MPKSRSTAQQRRNAIKGTPGDDVADRILRAIRRVLRQTAEHSRQLSREAGLTAPQLLCLRLIGQADPREEITAARLTDAVQLTAATVSRILDRLETLGLISRERAATDGRKMRLRVTRAGRARLRKLPIPLQETFLEQLNALPKKKREELLNSLEAIVLMMGAEGLDVAPVLATGVGEKPVG